MSSGLRAVRWVCPEGKEVDPDDPRLAGWWKAVKAVVVAAEGHFPAVVASLLTLAACEIPPNIKVSGNPPSALNLFSAVFGDPGLGKSSGFRLAKKILPPPPGVYKNEPNEKSFAITPLSGSGLIEAFLTTEKVLTGKRGRPREVRVRGNHPSVLARVDEGGRWEDLSERAANDIMSLVRSAFTAEDLDTSGASGETRRFVKEDSYRFCFLYFSQPRVGAASIKNLDSGTQQRFIALSCWDEDGGRAASARDVDGVAPTPPPEGNIFPPRKDMNGEEGEGWKPSSWETAEQFLIPVEETILAEITRYRRALVYFKRLEAGGAGIPANRMAEIREEVERTVGSEYFKRIDHREHTMLLRITIAAVLAYLRLDRSLLLLLKQGVSEEDWWMSYLVMAASAATWDDHNRIEGGVKESVRLAGLRRKAEEAGAEEEGRTAAGEYEFRKRMERPLRRAEKMTAAGDAPWGEFWEGLGGWRTESWKALKISSSELQVAVREILAEAGYEVKTVPGSKGEAIFPPDSHIPENLF